MARGRQAAEPDRGTGGEGGAIRPVVDRSFTLDQTAEALAYVEQGRAKGKVVVKVR